MCVYLYTCVASIYTYASIRRRYTYMYNCRGMYVYKRRREREKETEREEGGGGREGGRGCAAGPVFLKAWQRFWSARAAFTL